MQRQARVAKDDSRKASASQIENLMPSDDGDERPSREQETRANDTIHENWDDVDWKTPSLLEAPPPRPGFVQRWIATKVQGEDTPANVSRRAREGWKPRDPETVPLDFPVPTISHGQHVGCIGVDGMVLMERPAGLDAAFRRKVRENTENQMSGVTGELSGVHRDGDPFGKPKMQTKTRVERGRIPVVADDEED